jgi:hypothetical protein
LTEEAVVMENYWTMNKLGPTEYDLIGNWVQPEGGIRADDTAKRIEWLTTHVLEKWPTVHSMAHGKPYIVIRLMAAFGNALIR